MLELQGTKKVIGSASYTNAATDTVQIDTLGYDYATIDLIITVANTTSNVPSVIKLQEADVTNTSSFVDVAGSSFTSALTSQGTTNPTILTWDVNTTYRKRYINVVVSPLTTQTITVCANLSRAEQLPVTATQKNVTAWITL